MKMGIGESKQLLCVSKGDTIVFDDKSGNQLVIDASYVYGQSVLEQGAEVSVKRFSHSCYVAGV